MVIITEQFYPLKICWINLTNLLNNILSLSVESCHWKHLSITVLKHFIYLFLSVIVWIPLSFVCFFKGVRTLGAILRGPTLSSWHGSEPYVDRIKPRLAVCKAVILCTIRSGQLLRSWSTLNWLTCDVIYISPITFFCMWLLVFPEPFVKEAFLATLHAHSNFVMYYQLTTNLRVYHWVLNSNPFNAYPYTMLFWLL